MTTNRIFFAPLVLLAALFAACTSSAPVASTSSAPPPAASGAPASTTPSDEETQMGDQVWSQLKAQGEIVKSSPLYDTLKPIASSITRVVQPQYPYPIHFYIVHDKQPNAFATPGGNVYVVDSLFYFVHNREELAGTLCHETSHLLHHDSMKEMRHDREIRAREAVAVLLGKTWRVALAASAIGSLDSLHYSRGQEESADLMGSDTCAAAGVNPWGLVWLFNDFQNSNLQTPPEVLSDHPDNANRVAALEKHFKQAPTTFGGFNTDPQSATPLVVPKNPAEQFLK